MAYYTDSANTPPHNTPFSGFPRVLIPKAPVLINWYQVPYQYLLSEKAKYVEWIGRINYDEWYGWEEGMLLYLGVKLLRDPYTPPVPEFEIIGNLPSPSTFKLVDLQFMFVETVREAQAVYTPVNLSHIAAQPVEAQKKAQAATEKVKNHTWEERMKRVLQAASLRA